MADIIPKPKSKIPEWQNILFYCSLVLLLAVISVYFVFGYFQNKSLQSLQGLETELRDMGSQSQKELERDVLLYEKKIQDFGILLAQHRYTANFLKILQNFAYEDTQFTDLFLDVSGYKATLRGQTSSFKNLGEQVNKLEQEEFVKKVELSSMFMNQEGRVDFTFNLEISPKAFQKI